MAKKRSHGDGALYFLPKRKLWRGVIDLGINPETGKRVQKSVHSRTQAECRAKLREIQSEVEKHGAPLDRTATVSEWAEIWLETIKKPQVDPNTFAGYQSSVKRWIKPHLGQRTVASLKPSDVTGLGRHVINSGRSSTTALGVHRAISMMLDDARKEGLCARNVAADVKPPKKAVSKRGSIPVADAAKILAEAALMDLGSMFWFKLLGGPRQSEALGARLEDLDLELMTYQVNWALEEVPREHGCGTSPRGSWLCGKKRGAACPDAKWRVPDGFEMQHIEGRWCLTPPKSQRGRFVPLVPQLAEMIKAYLERRAGDPNPHGLIWRKPDGLPYTPKEESAIWRQLLFRAGIITEKQLAPGKSEITGHWARHTTVTLLASLGVDFQIIGEIVGHSSEEVTRIYRHANAAEKATAMERLGQLMITSGN